MSLLRNLTGITTPASTDLFYVVQNNTDYKMTSEQFLNFAKSAIVVSLTQAQYDALTPAEKSNGSIYLINDATLSASDIAYGQGTVEDSLDEITDELADKTVLNIVNGAATTGNSIYGNYYYTNISIDNTKTLVSAMVTETTSNKLAFIMPLSPTSARIYSVDAGMTVGYRLTYKV